METALEIKNLTRKYGSYYAVNNISIQVKKGEIFSFLGVNGAGKTTSIKMIVGILKPTSGSIHICGHNVQSDARKAKMITGYIPDRPYMYAKLTGREFIKFVAELYSVPSKLIHSRGDELIEKFGLMQWANDLIENYSHGMKQRLATAAALIHDPQVLIIDEPMVGLDPRGAKLLKDSLREYAEQGKSIFLSTHSLNVAEELSDRMAIIQQGQILSVGSLDQVREQASRSPDEKLESVFLELTSEMTKPQTVDANEHRAV